MELTPLENLFLYRYARLILDNKQGLAASVGSDRQLMLGRLFSSLQPQTSRTGDSGNMARQLRTQSRQMSCLADSNIHVVSKLKESARILALIRNNLQRMEQILAALRGEHISFSVARAEFERLALENKLHLEQLKNASRQIEQEKIGEKSILPAKGPELVAGTECCPQPDKQDIGADLKTVVTLLEQVEREQGLLETQAQELYFGADTVLAAVGESGANMENTLCNAANMSVGSLLNEQT